MSSCDHSNTGIKAVMFGHKFGVMFPILLLVFADVALGSFVFPSRGGMVIKSRHARDVHSDERPDCQPDAEVPPTRVNSTLQLTELRVLMESEGIDAYIIPMDDQHQSEYVSERDKRVEFISGFSGSAGVVAVLHDKAALWSDGRYFLQMDAELDCNWILMKTGVPETPSISDWLLDELSDGDVVAADPRVLSYDSWKHYEDNLEGLSMEERSNNLVDEVWNDIGGRPEQENSPLLVLDVQYAGKTWQDKLSEIRSDMTEKSLDAVVVTFLDESAWLFNMRGSDVPYNPVFFAYTIIEQDKVSLYLHDHINKLTAEVRDHLNVPDNGVCASNSDCTNVKPYVDFFTDLRSVADVSSGLVWVSPMSSYAVYSALGNTATERDARAYLMPSLLRVMKGRKNPTEVSSMRNCHKRDSAVLIQFLTMLEKEVKDGQHWTEISASNKLGEMRRETELNQGLSFGSISASGPNGAIIHYTASEATNRDINTDEMYLLDSGGQYLDGTTDVTRTFHFGTPTDIEKEAYTRVLMGAINLAMAVWPNETYGRDVDVLAREPLWSVGWDYRHGTGHGLGMFLNVHEGPGRIRIGYRSGDYETPMYGEMFFSDEPGYYEDGAFGVRLETIVMTKKVETEHEFGGGDYLGFEEFTLVPFEPTLIRYELLNYRQRRWLNAYNERCLKEVGEAILRDSLDDQAAYEWVRDRTQPIPDQPTFNGAVVTTPALLLLLIASLLANN